MLREIPLIRFGLYQVSSSYRKTVLIFSGIIFDKISHRNELNIRSKVILKY